MDWKDWFYDVARYVPNVSQPQGHVPLKRKAFWSGITLVVYFFLTNVVLFGLSQGGGSDVFGQFRSILAGAQGSILQLGIGPLVTGSIVMQLLNGADILEIDRTDPRDKTIYQALQKLLVFFVIIVTSLPLVFSGFLPPSTRLAGLLGISPTAVEFIIFLQVVLGGVIILLLDEIVSKWGIGSGVGLFIIAGISQRFIGGLVTQLLPAWFNILTGQLEVSVFSSSGFQTLVLGQGQLLAIATTIIIFLTVVYAESTKINIPLQHAQHKGARGSYPLKLIYASVLPLIFVRAIQANIQLAGNVINQFLGENMPQWLGVYSNSRPVSGLFYYLSPIQQPESWMWWLGTTADPIDVLIRLSVDITFMVIGGAIFAIFWVETADMGPAATAKKISQSNMQLAGFRNNQRSIEKRLERYIPAIAMLGGAIVGFLAVAANLLGTIGGVSGTGLLLAVSITQRIAQEVAEESQREMMERFGL